MSNPYVHVWRKIDAARAGTKYEKLEKLWAAIGSLKGERFSKSTWYSYQRWFEDDKDSPGTSPTVLFLSHVAGLLRLHLILDVESSARTAAERTRGGAQVPFKNPDAVFVAELMEQLPPEARAEVRRFALSKVGESIHPREGDEPAGPRPSPK